MVYQLIYVSTAICSTGDSEIADILATARRNNKASGITGLLLCHGGTFFQTLEGDQDTVTACFGSIERDSRHKDAVVLMRKAQEHRVFSQWSMGHAVPEKLSPNNRDTVISLSSLAKDLAAAPESQRHEASMLAASFVRGFREFDQI